MYLFRLFPGTLVISHFPIFIFRNHPDSGIKWPVCVSHFNSKVYVSRRLTTPATRSHVGSGWDSFSFLDRVLAKKVCVFVSVSKL